MQLCNIVLSDIPKQLRELFKQKFLAKCGKQWVDSQVCGAWLMEQERWHVKLLPCHKEKLSYGQSEEWDPPLLFHILLYSSHCLLADSITITRAILQHQSAVVSSVSCSVDLNDILQSGDVVLFDLGTRCFCSTVVTTHKDHFALKHAFKSEPSHVQNEIKVSFYKCRPEWLAVKQLFQLRDKYLSYCKTASMTDTELQQVLHEVRYLYGALNVSGLLMPSLKGGK